MAKKKKLYAVYKNINSESLNFGEMYYSLSHSDLKVGAKIGDNECVFIGDDLPMIQLMVNSTYGAFGENKIIL